MNFFCDLVDMITDNPIKSALVVVGTIATGGAFWVAAPAIATTLGATGVLGVASTGTAISTLSGAASTSASLAALGGGSLATGGLGMAGGTAVISATGTVTGAVVSGTAVKLTSSEY